VSCCKVVCTANLHSLHPLDSVLDLWFKCCICDVKQSVDAENVWSSYPYLRIMRVWIGQHLLLRSMRQRLLPLIEAVTPCAAWDANARISVHIAILLILCLRFILFFRLWCRDSGWGGEQQPKDKRIRSLSGWEQKSESGHFADKRTNWPGECIKQLCSTAHQIKENIGNVDLHKDEPRLVEIYAPP